MKKILLIIPLLILITLACSSPDSVTAPSVEDEVVDEAVSEHSCETDADCVFTPLVNIPTSSAECKCHRPLCPPTNAVNVTKKNAREQAYEEFCGGINSYILPDGSSCPIAGCVQVCHNLICENNVCTAQEYECTDNDHNNGDVMEPTIVEDCLIDHDSYEIAEMSITEDILTIEVSYGGGCVEHEFQLLISKCFLESDPVQAQMILLHDAKGDMCETLITRELEFDLSGLKEIYQDAYATNSGTIVLNISNASVVYSFGTPGISLTGEEDCNTLYSYLGQAKLQMRQCTSDSDCTPLWIESYGSCGCTNNLVVNKNADTTDYETIIDTLNKNEQCGLSSTCDCPEVDGVICQNNLCQWNYI